HLAAPCRSDLRYAPVSPAGRPQPPDPNLEGGPPHRGRPLATAVIIGSVGAAIAYQVGPPTIVATFDFAYVGFAAIWGFVFFAEVPGAVTVAGMILIVVAGLLVTRRSQDR
ncbi:MAG: DMT family transporter, partial [Rhodospirillaceae bacterium]|nr:DMT family transporter [Rhodospirillaceae bacterium]